MSVPPTTPQRWRPPLVRMVVYGTFGPEVAAGVMPQIYTGAAAEPRAGNARRGRPLKRAGGLAHSGSRSGFRPNGLRRARVLAKHSPTERPSDTQRQFGLSPELALGGAGFSEVSPWREA